MHHHVIRLGSNQDPIFANTRADFVILWSLYGMKSSGDIWRYMISQKMMDLGFNYFLDDPDVWMKTLPNPMVLSIGNMCLFSLTTYLLYLAIINLL